MKPQAPRHFLFCGAIVLGVLCLSTVEAQEADQQILSRLSRTASIDYLDEPLQDVAQDLRETLDIDVVLDRQALESGMGIDIPITLYLEEVSLHAALDLMLRGRDLEWFIRDGAVWITTPEQAESYQTVRAHPVGDLVRVGQDGEHYEYTSLYEIITTTVAPTTWSDLGGAGVIRGYRGALLVSQTRRVHDQIDRLLKGIRQVRADQEEVKAISLDSERERSIRAKYQQPVSLNFRETPLTEVAATLSEELGFFVLLDARALEDLGIGTDTPISFQADELPLQQALGRMLNGLELTWTVTREVLLITTEEAAESEGQIRLYPVSDLAEAPTVDQGAQLDELIELVTRMAEPDSWDGVGGPGSVTAIPTPPALVISQTESVHRKIDDLLERLRTARRAELDRPAPAGGEEPLVVRPMQLAAYPFLQNANGEPQYDVEQAIVLIQQIMGEEIWKVDGAFIRPLGHSIVVRHSAEVQVKLQTVLSKIGVWSPPPAGQGGGGFGGGGMF